MDKMLQLKPGKDIIFKHSNPSAYTEVRQIAMTAFQQQKNYGLGSQFISTSWHARWQVE
jgi:hypothetical protein|tara:strand:- start:957 stop:1133 length:177 start_codon:yes stop_codon:yes gene_type:complete